MSLIGQSVKIIVTEPWEWSGENLLGTIHSTPSENKLIIKLTKPFKGKKLISNLIELKPRYEREVFTALAQNNAVTIGGALITDNANELEYVIIGKVAIH